MTQSWPLKRERAFQAVKMPVICYNVHLGLTQSKMASDVKKSFDFKCFLYWVKVLSKSSLQG